MMPGWDRRAAMMVMAPGVGLRLKSQAPARYAAGAPSRPAGASA